jgi:hypothetical protein
LRSDPQEAISLIQAAVLAQTFGILSGVRIGIIYMEYVLLMDILLGSKAS